MKTQKRHIAVLSQDSNNRLGGDFPAKRRAYGYYFDV